METLVSFFDKVVSLCAEMKQRQRFSPQRLASRAAALAPDW